MERDFAKAVNFGLLYGQGAKGLREYARNRYGVRMTLEEARHERQWRELKRGNTEPGRSPEGGAGR